MEKKFVLCATKKMNILTLVLSEKKILNETKKHNPPHFKLNGQSLIGIEIKLGHFVTWFNLLYYKVTI